MSNFFIFILGISIGSFLNVLIDRWSAGESIMGRSHCDHCHHKLVWYNLIPIISYFFLKGKCSYCNKRISFFYPLVEFITGLIFVLGWIYFPGDVVARIIFLAILSSLIVIFFADLKYQVIPDEVQISFLLFSIALLIFEGTTFLIFFRHILAAFLLMFVILSLFLLTKGKGMGFGDVKLAFTIGLLLGVKTGFLSLYIAFVFGAIVGLALIIAAKKKPRSKIAFGPFLVSGILVVVFWQDKIWAVVKRIYGF